jgi:hypothetical protein
MVYCCLSKLTHESHLFIELSCLLKDFSWKIIQGTDMRANHLCMYESLATLSIVEQPIYRIFYGQGFGGMRRALRNFSYQWCFDQLSTGVHILKLLLL